MKNNMKENNNINLTQEEKEWILSMRKITPEMAPTLEKYPTLENFLQEIGLPKKVSFNRRKSAYTYSVHINEEKAYLAGDDKIYQHEPESKTYLLTGLVWEAQIKGIFGSNVPLILRVQIHHGRVIYAEISEFGYEIHSDNLGPNSEYCPQVAETLFKDFKQQLDKAISLAEGDIEETEEDIKEYQSLLKDTKRKLRGLCKMKEYLKNKQ